MPQSCPQCQSVRIKKRNVGKHLGAVLGTIIGAIGGGLSTATGIGIGKEMMIPFPPMRSLPGAIAGAITGAATGAAIGDALDSEVFDTHLCFSCGNTFNPTRFESPMWDNR